MSLRPPLPSYLETDPEAISDVLVGLPGVVVLGAAATTDERVELHVMLRADRAACRSCGVPARFKGWRTVVLADASMAARRVSLHWHKRRWRCEDTDCGGGAWTEQDERIAPPRMKLTRRAALRATEDVGRRGRTVAEVADELGCDWHTVNDAVMSFGTALLDADTERVGAVSSLGLDEVLFAKLGARRRAHFATSIVDVDSGQLLDVVPGRGGEHPRAWIEQQSDAWRAGIRFGTLDLSASFRSVFVATLPDATLVADPFHVVRHANAKLDECRRRVQNETLGHRGRKHDPLFRSRRLLTLAEERLSDDGREKLLGLLRAGDPHGDVAATWHAKEAVRELYAHADEDTAIEWIDHLIDDMADAAWPTEVRSLGRTLARWRNEIVAWHRSAATNGPTEAANNLVKRVKRVAFGLRSFANFRVRALLYAGRPTWALLPTLWPA